MLELLGHLEPVLRRHLQTGDLSQILPGTIHKALHLCQVLVKVCPLNVQGLKVFDLLITGRQQLLKSRLQTLNLLGKLLLLVLAGHSGQGL